MFNDTSPYQSPRSEAEAPPRAGRSTAFRVGVGLVHALIGFVIAFLAVSHKCEKSNPQFERPFLIVVPFACFLLVLVSRRYRYALLVTVVLLYVSFEIGEYYVYLLQR